MKFTFVDANGRIVESHNNDTTNSLPNGAVEIGEEQWESRFNFRWGGQKWIFDPVARPIEEICGDVWNRIKAKRDALTLGGVKVGTKWFHSDQKSRSQQLGLVLLGANIPANLQWKTMDSSFCTMTATLAQQLLGAVAASDQAIFAAAETHKAAMEASADPASYNFSTGWPKGYGE